MRRLMKFISEHAVREHLRGPHVGRGQGAVLSPIRLHQPAHGDPGGGDDSPLELEAWAGWGKLPYRPFSNRTVTFFPLIVPALRA